VAAHRPPGEDFRLQSTGAADDGRQVTEQREIGEPVRVRLVHGRASAAQEGPADLDAVLPELLFEHASQVHGRNGVASRRWPVADANPGVDETDLGGGASSRGEGKADERDRYQENMKSARARVHEDLRRP